jgi:hypothetical protein
MELSASFASFDASKHIGADAGGCDVGALQAKHEAGS